MVIQEKFGKMESRPEFIVVHAYVFRGEWLRTSITEAIVDSGEGITVVVMAIIEPRWEW